MSHQPPSAVTSSGQRNSPLGVSVVSAKKSTESSGTNGFIPIASRSVDARWMNRILVVGLDVFFTVARSGITGGGYFIIETNG